VQVPVNNTAVLHEAGSAGPDNTWFVTGFRLPVDDVEMFVIHNLAQDEQEALQQALVVRAQASRATA
jgi:hypothetical protein